MTRPAGSSIPGATPVTPADGLSLYVHVPFCARACPYCDFDFVVGRRPDVATFMAGLKAELDLRLPPGRRPRPRTVYIGGGTPSLLSIPDLRALVTRIGARFDLTQVEEHTVELNPEHVDRERLDALRELGVDRVSIGLQSTAARGLVQLGRAHSVAAGLASVQAAAAAGLRTSADLIVGWPGQTPGDLARDVKAVTDAGAEHVSIYALTIEPHTPWPRLVARG